MYVCMYVCMYMYMYMIMYMYTFLCAGVCGASVSSVCVYVWTDVDTHFKQTYQALFKEETILQSSPVPTPSFLLKDNIPFFPTGLLTLNMFLSHFLCRN